MGVSFDAEYWFYFGSEDDAKAFYDDLGDRTVEDGAHFDVDVPIIGKDLQGQRVYFTSGGYGCVDLTEFNKHNVIGCTYSVWSCQAQDIYYVLSLSVDEFNYHKSDPYNAVEYGNVSYMPDYDWGDDASVDAAYDEHRNNFKRAVADALAMGTSGM